MKYETGWTAELPGGFKKSKVVLEEQDLQALLIDECGLDEHHRPSTMLCFSLLRAEADLLLALDVIGKGFLTPEAADKMLTSAKQEKDKAIKRITGG